MSEGCSYLFIYLSGCVSGEGVLVFRWREIGHGRAGGSKRAQQTIKDKMSLVFPPQGAKLQPRVLPLVEIQAKTSWALGKPMQVAQALSWLHKFRKFLDLSHSTAARPT